MTRAVRNVILVFMGVLSLWLLTTLLQSLAREGPDRTSAVQLPLFLTVLGAPAVAYVARRRLVWLPALILVGQLGAYVLYETGISINTNIRVDLLLTYPAILFTAWLALRAAELPNEETPP